MLQQIALYIVVFHNAHQIGLLNLSFQSRKITEANQIDVTYFNIITRNIAFCNVQCSLLKAKLKLFLCFKHEDV
jgi:hypothetical protein